ncbi:MAG: spondin domain-containing protein [Myxococcota bacterium]
MRRIIFFYSVVLLATACGDDDNSVSMDGGDGATTFTVEIENLSPAFEYPASGALSMPANMPNPIADGESYTIEFKAAPRYPMQMDGTTRFSFATMLILSNDYFFAPAGTGLPLFDANDMPITGDRTSLISIWDAGTEIDQELGNGANQPGPEGTPGGDPDPDNTVRLVDPSADDDLPPVDELIQVVVSAEEIDREWNFTVTITNISGGSSLEGPYSNGVWVVHHQTDSDSGPIFTAGMPDRGEGLEVIAEDGVPDPDMGASLADTLEADTGLSVIFSPGVWAVHTSDNPFFTSGEENRTDSVGDGLELLAEDGANSTLATAIADEPGILSSNTFGDGPTGPGGTVSFEVTAEPGDRFSLVTMVVPSNDFVFASPDVMGFELFTDEAPRSGVISDLIYIWDVGTEINQTPGVGLDAIVLQDPAGNQGAADPDNTVRIIHDESQFPAASTVFQVTVTPAS